jgi:hypothetical protein
MTDTLDTPAPQLPALDHPTPLIDRLEAGEPYWLPSLDLMVEVVKPGGTKWTFPDA